MAATLARMAMVGRAVRAGAEQSGAPERTVCYPALTVPTAAQAVPVATVALAVWAVSSLAMAAPVATVEPAARVEQADQDKKAWTLYCPARTADLVATAVTAAPPASAAAVAKAARREAKGSPERAVTVERVASAAKGVKVARAA